MAFCPSFSDPASSGIVKKLINDAFKMKKMENTKYNIPLLKALK